MDLMHTLTDLMHTLTNLKAAARARVASDGCAVWTRVRALAFDSQKPRVCERDVCVCVCESVCVCVRLRGRVSMQRVVTSVHEIFPMDRPLTFGQSLSVTAEQTQEALYLSLPLPLPLPPPPLSRSLARSPLSRSLALSLSLSPCRSLKFGQNFSSVIAVRTQEAPLVAIALF
eukprot:6209707-Pleurochrysis_carterae.AAC.2